MSYNIIFENTKLLKNCRKNIWDVSKSWSLCSAWAPPLLCWTTLQRRWSAPLPSWDRRAVALYTYDICSHIYYIIISHDRQTEQTNNQQTDRQTDGQLTYCWSGSQEYSSKWNISKWFDRQNVEQKTFSDCFQNQSFLAN